jgi:hypothetical protein
MTEKNSALMTIEKIKSFAIALVGAGIFSMGSTYFSEQAEYRIPRILLPIYEIFGNVGLAIGMMILGTGLIYFAYRKFTQNNGKSIVILAFSIIAILGFYGIIFSTSSKKTSIEDIKSSIEKNQQKTKDEIANTERPNLDNELANAYLDKLEALERKFEKAVNEKNKVLFEECYKEYDIVGYDEIGNVIKEMSNKPEYRDFIMYNAKVSERIQVFRTHKW